MGQRQGEALLRAISSLAQCVLRWPDTIFEAYILVVDHAWLFIAFVVSLCRVSFRLAPFDFERYCFAKAYHLDQPRFSVAAKWVDTAKVNNGKDVLRATLWTPVGADGPLPTVVIRNPYGNHSAVGVEWGQIILAERGYAVLLQDTRGRFGSDGDFVPVENEREDGAETVRWVRQQPWCNGKVAVFGISYLGLTAWACVGGLKSGELQAAVPIVAQSRVHSVVFREGGGFSLELLITWLTLVLKVMVQPSRLDALRSVVRMWFSGHWRTAAEVAPLCELDEQLLGYKWPFFQAALTDPAPDGAFWRSRDVLCELRPGHAHSVVPPPIHIISCWYDFFCTQALHDFEMASRSQPHAKLTVLPCGHWGLVSLEAQQLMFRSLLACLDEHLAGLKDQNRRALPMLEWYDLRRSADDGHLPIQLCMLGSRRWKGFGEWPPQARSRPLYLLHSGQLWRAPPAVDAARTLSYVYVPSAPTPAHGGASFNPFNSGSHWQHSIERRADVLVFTSAPMATTLAVAGRVTLKLRAAAAARSIDLLGRLCLVSRRGVSINLCEGKVRLQAAPGESAIGGDDGVDVLIEMGSVAVDFEAGTRIRLHVCSAAHPRWMRNLCGDPQVPLAYQTCGDAAKVTVWTDNSRSQLVLPVVQ